jgi:hypothetical protein
MLATGHVGKSGRIFLYKARNDAKRSKSIERRTLSGKNSCDAEGVRTTTEKSPSAANHPKRAGPSAAMLSCRAAGASVPKRVGNQLCPALRSQR